MLSLFLAEVIGRARGTGPCWWCIAIVAPLVAAALGGFAWFIYFGPLTRLISPEVERTSVEARRHREDVERLSLLDAENRAMALVEGHGEAATPNTLAALSRIAIIPPSTRRLFSVYSRVTIPDAECVLVQKDVGPARLLRGLTKVGHGLGGEELAVDPATEEFYLCPGPTYRSRVDAARYKSVFHWIVYQQTLPEPTE